MSKVNSLIVATLFLGVLVSTAGAVTTVTQVGDQLSVTGDDTDDSVYIRQSFWDSSVWVRDGQTGVNNYYFGVSQVVVDTADGNDYVDIFDYASGSRYDCSDVQVLTGNGDDSVNIFSEQGGSFVDVSTGNGQDYVSSNSRYTDLNGGGIDIDTGNGKDEVNLSYSSRDILNVGLGNGNDVISGYISYSTFGIFDGGNGKDSCSSLDILHGFFTLTNFEK
jgi:hypothetical protein